MNEQRAQYASVGQYLRNPINSDLITMQIQALRESLRRLVDTDDLAEIKSLGDELKEKQA